MHAGKPLTNVTWLFNVQGPTRREYENRLIDYFARQKRVPDIVVRMSRVPRDANDNGIGPTAYLPIDPLERLFKAPRYLDVRNRPDYEILQRDGTDCRR